MKHGLAVLEMGQGKVLQFRSREHTMGSAKFAGSDAPGLVGLDCGTASYFRVPKIRCALVLNFRVWNSWDLEVRLRVQAHAGSAHIVRCRARGAVSMILVVLCSEVLVAKPSSCQ